jgi:hypothetical protein
MQSMIWIWVSSQAKMMKNHEILYFTIQIV